MMRGLIEALDKANKDYTPPRKLDSEVAKTVDEVYTKATNEVEELKKANKEVENRVKVSEKALNDLCNELKKNISEEEMKEMEEIRGECGNIFNNLNVNIGLKGQKITDEDVAKQVKSVVNQSVNGHSLLSYAVAQGNKDGVERLLKAGAETGPSTNYKRSFLQTLKDGFKDFPRGFIKKPERTLEEIAKMQGNSGIAESIQKAKEERSQPPSQTVDTELLKTLQSTMDGKGPSVTLESDKIIKENPSRQKGIFSRLKQVSKNKEKVETPVDPLQTQLNAIDKRLEEMKKEAHYQFAPEHPHKVAAMKEESLLNRVRDELTKDPIDREAVNTLIEKGREEMSKDARVDVGRGLSVQSNAFLENVQDAIEPPRSTVGVKSSSSK